MRIFGLLVVLSIMLSACSKKAPPESGQLYSYRLPHPGIVEGRPDTLEEKYFIKRFDGLLGNSDSIPVELLLVNWGNGKLTGQTYYPQQGGVLSFDGKLENDGRFTLEEERYNSRFASFHGTFHGVDSMSGIWMNIDSSQSLPFTYKEHITPLDYDLWTGTWHLNDPWDTVQLIIGGLTERRLQFAMNIYINGYTEELFGTAEIFGQRAIMDVKLDPIFEETCRIIFHRRGREIYIEQISFPFLCRLGPNCWIDRTYDDIYYGKEARIDFIGKDSVFADSAVYQAFKKFIDDETERKFAYNMERLEKHTFEDSRDKINGTYWKGRVRGFHREKEGIIAYDENNNIWAATTTPPTSFMGPMKVHYYTNVSKWKNKRPEVIKNWMEKFQNCTVVYESK